MLQAESSSPAVATLKLLLRIDLRHIPQDSAPQPMHVGTLSFVPILHSLQAKLRAEEQVEDCEMTVKSNTYSEEPISDQASSPTQQGHPSLLDLPQELLLQVHLRASPKP